MKVLFSSLICCLFVFSGCEKKHDFYANIEQNGSVYSAYVDDINESDVIKTFLREQQNIESPVNENDELVFIDKNIYNFLVVTPVKTTSRIFEDFEYRGYSEYLEFRIYKCNSNEMYLFAYMPYKNVEDIDGNYFHNLYSISSHMYAENIFKKISDLCISYDYSWREGDDTYNYETNTLKINSDEIENILDNLGIAYE